MAKKPTGNPYGRPIGTKLSHDVRDRIKAGQLLTRWQGIANGTVTGDPALLAIQERAIKGLLAKCLPDLKLIEHTGEGGGAVEILWRMEQKPPDLA